MNERKEGKQNAIINIAIIKNFPSLFTIRDISFINY
jgi:hypothetical protein